MDIVLRGAMDGAETAETAPYGFQPYQSKELRAALEVALVKTTLERRLRESECWFASALRCVGDAVIATDPGGVVTFLNPVAEQMTRRSHDEARDQPIEQTMPLTASPDGKAMSPVRRALSENRAIDLERGGRPVDASDLGALQRTQLISRAVAGPTSTAPRFAGISASVFETTTRPAMISAKRCGNSGC